MGWGVGLGGSHRKKGTEALPGVGLQSTPHSARNGKGSRDHRLIIVLRVERGGLICQPSALVGSPADKVASLGNRVSLKEREVERESEREKKREI